jgi:hypothetical protein
MNTQTKSVVKFGNAVLADFSPKNFGVVGCQCMCCAMPKFEYIRRLL